MIQEVVDSIHYLALSLKELYRMGELHLEHDFASPQWQMDLLLSLSVSFLCQHHMQHAPFED